MCHVDIVSPVVTYLSILLNTNTVPFLVSISKSKYLVVLPVPLEKLTQLISSNLMCMGGLCTYMKPLSSGYRKPLLDLCEQLMVLAPPNLKKKNKTKQKQKQYMNLLFFLLCRLMIYWNSFVKNAVMYSLYIPSLHHFKPYSATQPHIVIIFIFVT